jgi:hypothetical protein
MTTTRRLAAILIVDVAGCWRLSRQILMFAALLVPLSSTTAAQTEPTTTIHLVWTEAFDRITPDPRVGIQTRKSMTISLHGKNEITQTLESRAGRFNRSSTSRAQLGNGWRVGADNVLVRTDEYSHHVRVMTVTVDGRNLCSLSVVHQLKAGQSTYLHAMLSRPGQTGTYSRIATQSVDCSIK